MKIININDRNYNKINFQSKSYSKIKPNTLGIWQKEHKITGDRFA